ncbi:MULTISPECIES: penicillin-binding protein activator [unclassified Acinetobacter]|uniref:penicillin-binding protein activator n=1 Tax=unclassified Acinetobacter TaxID=196816 RepID=UPI0035B70298
MFIEKMKKTLCHTLRFTSIFAMLSVYHVAHAEILVILPETDALANASASIKQGLLEANKINKNKYQLKFVDEQLAINEIYQRYVNKDTQLVIGPLNKADVEQLIKLQPKVKTLALNRVNGSAKNVYQFALSKDEDAATLTRRMQVDGIEHIIVLREPASVEATQTFYDEMKELWGENFSDTARVTASHQRFDPNKQGILLLGSSEWMNQQKLPTKNLYTIPYGIEEQAELPTGLTFCDTPALYNGQWQDVINAYKQKPVSMPLQRLLAFGGDAWQIADIIISKQKEKNLLNFKGRTGDLKIIDRTITRQAQCFSLNDGVLKQLEN